MLGEDPKSSEWALQSARWMSGPCHRSLYGYQMRTALGLAVENPHLAVTFIPLACSGATVNSGFLDSQRASECPSPGTGAACPGTTRAQVAELTDLLVSGLIADISVEPGTERSLLTRGGLITSVDEAQRILDRDLPGNFTKVRAARLPGRSGPALRAPYVSYGNLAPGAPNTPCPGGVGAVSPCRDDMERMVNGSRAMDFVSQRFL